MKRVNFKIDGSMMDDQIKVMKQINHHLCSERKQCVTNVRCTYKSCSK